MAFNRNPLSQFLFIIGTFFLSKHFCFAIETIISPTQLIRYSDSITSSNQLCRLGFFSPSNSKNHYLGIWYIVRNETTVVWVANRENPLTDSSGILRISSDSNLVVLDGRQKVIWTTDVSVSANSSEAALLDTGNLVIREVNSNGNATGRILWQSFDHPTDTLLQDMRISANIKTGEKNGLTSWKSDSDPSKGRFHGELEPLNVPQFVVWNGSRRHWRTGPWNGKVFIGIEGIESGDYRNGFTIVSDEHGGNAYLFFKYSTNNHFLLRYVLTFTGKIKELAKINKDDNGWLETYEWPNNDCEYYGKCGSFAFCRKLTSRLCSCLKGYEPTSKEEWRMGNWSRGCIRMTPLQCERNSTRSEEGKGDGFLKYARMKVPDFVVRVETRDLEDCSRVCLMNCSCTAYSFDSGIGCMLWHGDLIDMAMFSINGANLYTRVAYSELDKNRPTKLAIKISVPVGLVAVGLCLFISWKWMEKRKGKYNGKEGVDLPDGGDDSYPRKNEEVETSLFRYEILQIATDNFSQVNKLGEGGFGSVYKGKLLSGEEIAVKRLSKGSGQGTEEFKNEVAVISRLQHRNLVKLLGFCIEGEEKMLIYELMPNKSLDVFLFDPWKKALITWRKCFDIIEGIARGIIYLHRDSRLKVVHRDLKPSNILLDRDLNPKISDFGMARIVGADELQANTRRVVGTYGYMAPEYAMEGVFSEKSDVYSFGVLLLEIVTGMRNTGFYHHEASSSLISHVWKFWNENKGEDVIDSTLSEPAFTQEMLRCIHVGLLCVQDFAKDRPTMPSVISMLSSDITRLPPPNQPAFTGLQGTCSTSSYGSVNDLSITMLGGR